MHPTADMRDECLSASKPTYRMNTYGKLHAFCITHTRCLRFQIRCSCERCSCCCRTRFSDQLGKVSIRRQPPFESLAVHEMERHSSKLSRLTQPASYMYIRSFLSYTSGRWMLSLCLVTIMAAATASLRPRLSLS